MIKKLRLRLTVIFSVLTSLVLLIAVGVAFGMGKASYLQGREIVFENSLAAITDKLEKGESISDKWLGEKEASAMSIIFIFDNGVPLHFKGTWKPQTPRNRLSEIALKSTTENNIDFSQKYTVKKVAFYNITGDNNEPYRMAATFIPKLAENSHKYIGVAFLQDYTAVNNKINTMLLQYILLWALGTILLCVISRLLCGLAVKPTAAALKQQADFTAAASHELRSPLAVISASLQAAQSENLSPDKAQSFIKTAQAETLRLAHLTDDLLLLASGDAHALSINKKSLAPDTFCIELYEKYRTLAKDNLHELRIFLPDKKLPNILADTQRLTQLFGILITNAIEYTPKNTAVDIILEQTEKSIIISVQDYGEGVSKPQQSLIFNRFYRADNSRTDKSHFGLGLSIAKEIADLHGAKLTLCETDIGCKFKFEINIIMDFC